MRRMWTVAAALLLAMATALGAEAAEQRAFALEETLTLTICVQDLERDDLTSPADPGDPFLIVAAGSDDPAHVGAMPRIVLVGVFGVEGRETAAVERVDIILQSSCPVAIPVSSTATQTESSPIVSLHEAGASMSLMPQSLSKYGSLGIFSSSACRGRLGDMARKIGRAHV